MPALYSHPCGLRPEAVDGPSHVVCDPPRHFQAGLSMTSFVHCVPALVGRMV